MTYAARAIMALLRGYQRVISPLLGCRCRFHPTCSEYALQAVERFGAPRGAYLAARRLLRCTPFGPWGFDEVPMRFAWRRASGKASNEAKVDTSA